MGGTAASHLTLTPEGQHGNPLSMPAWRIPWTEEPGGYSPQGPKESDMTEVTEHACMRQTLKSILNELKI